MGKLMGSLTLMMIPFVSARGNEKRMPEAD